METVARLGREHVLAARQAVVPGDQRGDTGGDEQALFGLQAQAQCCGVRQLQQRSNRQERAEKVQAETTDQEQAVDEQIVQAEEAATQQEQIARALQLLSDRQREVLYLKYFEEIDYKQIAEMLGINYQSVRNTASAGLKALRKLLAWLLVFFVNL